MMDKLSQFSEQLAVNITKTASKQSYYTIRLLVDHERVADAYRAYGYFRWVDDVIDTGAGSAAERIAFAGRQSVLLESCYRGETPEIQAPEEWMLVDLIRHDTEKDSGLQVYLRNMMAVMVFDSRRRGQAITQLELDDYSHKLAKAVTEALYYFIGHDDATPCNDSRYLAVTAAHITHMLRDAFEDTADGYFNIPGEVLAARRYALQDVGSAAYREWVCRRVQQARRYFEAGRECTAMVRNWRCRLAGYAYIARFEWMLETIAHDNYCLRCDYPERKSLGTALWISWAAFKSMLASARMRSLAPLSIQIDKK